MPQLLTPPMRSEHPTTTRPGRRRPARAVDGPVCDGTPNPPPPLDWTINVKRATVPLGNVAVIVRVPCDSSSTLALLTVARPAASLVIVWTKSPAQVTGTPETGSPRPFTTRTVIGAMK